MPIMILKLLPIDSPDVGEPEKYPQNMLKVHRKWFRGSRISLILFWKILFLRLLKKSFDGHSSKDGFLKKESEKFLSLKIIFYVLLAYVVDSFKVLQYQGYRLVTISESWQALIGFYDRKLAFLSFSPDWSMKRM